MTDLTRLHAHEMAGLLRTRRSLVARADRGAPRSPPSATNHALNAWLTIDRDAGAAPRPTPPTPGSPHARPTRPTRSTGSTRCSASRSRSRTWSRVQGGQCTAGSRILEGYVAPVRRAHHRAAARGRRGHPRQDEHGRVRDGLVDRALGVRPDGQPVGPRSRAGRQQRRLGGGRGGVPHAAVASAPIPAARSASRRRCAASSA